MLIRLILAVDDRALERSLEQSITADDVNVEILGAERAPWQKVVRSFGDIIVISAPLIPAPAESSLAMLRELPENPTTVILHDSDSPEEHARLVAAGADVVLYSGVSRRRLVQAIEATIETRRQLIQLEGFDRRARATPKIGDFFSESEAMRLFMDEVRQVLRSNSVLLLLGETGSGKEHLARAIHAESPRSVGPFIAVNSAALPEQLLESELFGHEQGAFTGAIRPRRGAFDLAHGGTILLDEIGEMPLHLQAKMLRVLQDFEVTPVGGERTHWVDVRVIAASNRDLEKEVEAGNFRQDLFYRLSVVTLTIPPLRERVEDIPAMAQHFVDLYQLKLGREIDGLTADAIDAFCRYNWPGNVRELMNVIERAVLLCKGREIGLEHLPVAFQSGALLPRMLLSDQGGTVASWKDKTLLQVRAEVLDQVERLYLQTILSQTRGRLGRAAKIAGIHPRSLYNKMKRLGLRKEEFKEGR